MKRVNRFYLLVELLIYLPTYLPACLPKVAKVVTYRPTCVRYLPAYLRTWLLAHLLPTCPPAHLPICPSAYLPTY